MTIKASIVISVLTLIVYMLLASAGQYLLTEHWLIVTEVPTIYRWAVLALVFGTVFMMVKLWQKLETRLTRDKALAALLIIFLVSLIGKSIYDDYYRQLQKHPRIFDISQDWSIQGTRIKIEGKNFGAAHSPGSVKVNELVMINKKWGAQQIIVEQPVTGSFFKGELRVINSNGFASNPVEFTIRDPAEL